MSVNLFSYLQRPVITDNIGYYPMAMHGLIYTRQIAMNRYGRARFDYFQKNIDHSDPEKHYLDVHLYTSIKMGAGYEQRFGEKKVKPYFAGDILFTNALLYSETGGRDAGTYEKRQARQLGISFLPALGITLQVSRIVSFSVETNYELGYAHEKGTDFTWTADGIPLNKPLKHSLFIHRWNPVSLLAFELSF
ncbi:MAG: hypothetical protein J7K46_02610 [Bacteroidales bacterium]|nr:hypothetical protein [Bacteroidales bacterium]